MDEKIHCLELRNQFFIHILLQMNANAVVELNGVVVVGAGLAGCLTACYLRYVFANHVLISVCF
jgi:threonine dehydrogenase-like Zn-dependent dehydrogenase